MNTSICKTVVSHIRLVLSTVLTGLLLTTGCVNVCSASAEQSASAVVGSFSVGDGVSAGIDEQTGKFGTHIPLAGLAGLPINVNRTDNGTNVDGVGGFDLGISYRHDMAISGEIDRYGLGSAWTWNITFVNTDGGVRVFPASGGVYDADASYSSGLAGYTLGDLVFSQEKGVLPARDGVIGDVAYTYSLKAVGIGTDFFNASGDLVARVGMFGERVDLVWEPGNRLGAVIDAGGSRIRLVWTETGIEIFSPTPGEGFVDTAKTVLKITDNALESVTNPVGENVEFRYENTGLLQRVFSSQGAITDITYQQLSDGTTVVNTVHVTDAQTGAELSTRHWEILGEHTSSGWPHYGNQQLLWASGDNQYRYQTVLSDGLTDVTSEYNSLGLLLSREMAVSTPAGEMVVREHHFTYEVTKDESALNPHILPAQYSKPIDTQVTIRDENGHSRTLTEHNTYNTFGQVTQHVGSDETITETVYDTSISENEVLPGGLIREQTTTGPDGAVSKTVNTLTANGKAITATETFVGTSSGILESQTRTEFTVNTDGFVSETRVVATGSVSEQSQAQDVQSVVTRFNRTINLEEGTVTLSQTHATGTKAESAVCIRVDSATGLVLAETDPTGRIASRTYDALGRLVTYTDFSGLHTTTIYGDKVTRTQDPEGVTRSKYVNAIGQLVKVTDNLIEQDGVVVLTSDSERTIETRRYEQNSSHITITDQQGRETVSESDVFGRPVRVTAPNGVTKITEYNDVENTVTTAKSSGKEMKNASLVTITHKDDQDRNISVTGARKDAVSVPEETVNYDGLGRVTRRTHNDLSTNMVLNSQGKAEATTITPTDPHNFPGTTANASHEYNMLGVSTKKTVTQNGKKREGVSRVVDAAGRTASETDQEGNTTSYEYTVDGLLSVGRNNATGVVTRNTYDPITRAMTLTETTGPNNAGSITAYEYDPVTGRVIAIFDPFQRSETEIHYTYDVFGNTTSTHFPDGKTITHVFDLYGQTLSTTDTAGNTTRYEYDRLGLLTNATQTNTDGDVLGRVDYEYDVYGRVTVLKRDNGLETRYTFTSADDIATEKTTRGGATIYEGKYEYDSHGNLTQRVDTRTTALATPPSSESETGADQMVTETTMYTYNAYDQLTGSAVYPGVTSRSASPRERVVYEISISGNILKETTTTAQATTVRECEYNSLDHTTAITTNGNRIPQTYDTAGNLVHAADGTTYTYNVHNQPITETRPDGTRMEYTYWVNGQRSVLATTTPTGTETVNLYWDDSTLINDIHTGVKGEKATASYLIGGSRHMRTLQSLDERGKTIDYYVTDRHGNTVNMVNAEGNVTREYTYTNYGVPTEKASSSEPVTGASRNPFQYAGEYTTATGNQLLSTRVYAPTMMAFTTQDTANLFNLYAYGNVNPITLVDPTGNDALADVVVHGVLLCVTAIAGLLTLGGTVWAASVAAEGALSVSAWGWAALSTKMGAEAGAIGIDGALFANDFKDNGNKLFSETIAHVMAGISLILGVVSGVSAWRADKALSPRPFVQELTDAEQEAFSQQTFHLYRTAKGELVQPFTDAVASRKGLTQINHAPPTMYYVLPYEGSSNGNFHFSFTFKNVKKIGNLRQLPGTTDIISNFVERNGEKHFVFNLDCSDVFSDVDVFIDSHSVVYFQPKKAQNLINNLEVISPPPEGEPFAPNNEGSYLVDGKF